VPKIYHVYGDTSDYSNRSNAASKDDARNGLGTFSTFSQNNPSAIFSAYFLNSSYEYSQVYFLFDTSSVPSSNISSVRLVLVAQVLRTQDMDFELRVHNWSGFVSNTGLNWVAGNSLGSLTLLGSRSITGGFPAQTSISTPFTVNEVPRSNNFRFVGYRTSLRTGVEPVSGATDSYQFFGADQTGTSQDPTLIFVSTETTVEQVYNTNDSFVVPSGVTEVQIECYGGGGGGGPASSSQKPGGGGGAYARRALAVSTGDTLSITIGTGGGAGVAGNDTSVVRSGVTVCLAKGGSAPASSGASAAGAAGGVGTSCVGDIAYSGGNGGAAQGGGGSRGGSGGGSSASWEGSGVVGTAGNGSSGGPGGIAQGTDGGNGGGGGNASVNGNPGLAPGGGGGGAGSGNSAVSGSGANGRVIISYATGGGPASSIVMRRQYARRTGSRGSVGQ
jgi:hypothetical protein